MRVRSAVDTTTSSPRDPSPDGATTDSSRALRTLVLVAAGTIVAAYVVDRVRSPSDNAGDASLETIQKRTVEAVPSAVSDRVPDAVPTEPKTIPIGDVGSDEEETDETDETETDETDETETKTDTDTPSDDSASGAGEPIDDAEANADLDDDPSSTKVTSGSSDEIQEKPAEPGELSVDEDVEDVIDEDVGFDVDADESSADEDDGGSTADEDNEGSSTDEDDDDSATDEDETSDSTADEE